MYLSEIINWFDLAVGISLGLLFLMFWYYLTYFVIACIKVKKFKEEESKTKFAILVPARNESKVIRHILESFANLDYPRELFEVFIIIETKNDPTFEIVKEYGFQTVIRGELEGRRTKGFALDDAYQYIVKNNLDFDAFLVFDADNIVNSDYLKHMNNVYQNGYQIGVGYRSFTNSSKNWITATSATLFSFMNQFTSRGRSMLFKKATLTGTGYFIAKEIVDDIGYWYWNGMTEDVELTAYSYYHNIKMIYYPYAIYYDEEPVDFKTLHNQHVRWVWGYFSNKKRFKNEVGKYYPVKNKYVRNLSLIEYNFSIYPFTVFSILLALSSITSLIFAFVALGIGQPNVEYLFAHAIFFFVALRLVFVFVSAFTLAIDNNNLKFKWKLCIIVCITYLIFFGDFLFAFLDGFFHKAKRSTWKEIKHEGKIIDKDARGAKNG
ncbi:MAG: glycosyltransferase family 2 protein [Bacilli bacterium]|nr:glycosyltransferase family 2 protein [Bacilli bacterium]